MRIINLCQYIAHNPKHGGAIRVFHINKELGKYKDTKVIQFSFTPLLFRNEIHKTGNYTEHIKNPLIYTAMVILVSKIFRIHSFDFAIPFVFGFTRAPVKLVGEIKKADIIQVEHPWLFKWVYKLKNKYNPRAKMILDCHNVEYEQYKALLKNKVMFKRIILKSIKKTEGFAVKKADFCIAMCQEDINSFIKLYGVNKNKFLIIPTGVDINKYKPLPVKKKEKLKQRMGFKDKKIVLFTGARHPPNYEAFLKIKNSIAPKTRLLNKNILFVIAGHVCKKQSYENIICTGFVDDIIPYFKVADIAINPVVSGSGFNSKMIEYFAAALPVITTRHGSRGLRVRNNREVFVRDIKDFPKTINNLLKNKELKLSLARRAGGFIKECEWKRVVSRLGKAYEKLVKDFG